MNSLSKLVKSSIFITFTNGHTILYGDIDQILIHESVWLRRANTIIKLTDVSKMKVYK